MQTMPLIMFMGPLLAITLAPRGATGEPRAAGAQLRWSRTANAAPETRSERAEALTALSLTRLPQFEQNKWVVRHRKPVRNTAKRRFSTDFLGRSFSTAAASTTTRCGMQNGESRLRDIRSLRGTAPVSRASPGRPPLDALRPTGELIAGAAAGYAALGLGTGIARSTGGFYVTMVSIYPLGCALGVYAVGSLGNETGSFWATLVGSLSGVALSYFVGAATNDSRVFAALFYTTPLFRSVYLFNQSRRYESPGR